MCLCMGKIQKQRVGKRSLVWFMNEISVLKLCFRVFKLSNTCACMFYLCVFFTHIYIEAALLLKVWILLIVLALMSSDWESRAFGKH